MSGVEKWRLLHVEIPRNAGMNMALDEAIFLAMTEKAVPSTVRFWRNERAVVIGRSQSVDAEVNLELCEKKDVQVVRRLSGGGAVYHDLGNLNYTLVMDIENQLIRNLGITESYRVLSSGLVEGLKEFGLTPNFKPLTDIFIGDKKVSGSSQARKGGALLYHATLLVDTDLNMLKNVLNLRQEKVRGKVTSSKKPVTTLRDELGYEISMRDVKKAIARGLEKAFSIRLILGALSSMEKETAQNLYDSKYSQKEWSFR